VKTPRLRYRPEPSSQPAIGGRYSRGRRHRLAALAASVLLAGCFSTTPVQPGSESGTSEVFGIVYHVRDNVRTVAKGSWVRVTWHGDLPGGGRIQIGQPDVQGVDRNGTYRLKSRDPAVRWVKVEAISCRWNPDSPDPNIWCCLRDTPECAGCEALWVSGREMHTSPGGAVRVDVDVHC